MRKLGYKRFGRSTVKRILERNRLAPRPKHSGIGWHDFLSHYGEFIWACDFFTVTTATLRTYYVLFVIDIGSRKIRLCNVTEHPNEDWVIQQFRNLAIVHDDLPRRLIHDRDSKFTAHGDEVLRRMGTRPLRLPYRSPDLNAYAERWILSLKSEVLEHLILPGDRQLRRVLNEYLAHYHAERAHQGLSGEIIDPRHQDETAVINKVVRRKRLGGLLSYYHRPAA